MENLKISVVTTVLNEEESIHALLDSLLHQAKRPDELIIVDAGSTDATQDLVKDHQDNSPFPIKLISSPSANRSKGRNIGIEAAKNKYIAVIDAGCEAEPDWLKFIEAGFLSGHDVVAGFYLPAISSPLQKLFIPFLATSPNQVDVKTFLPSSRSLGFTKKAWKETGKYPEHLPTCEDLVFAKRLRARHLTIVKTDALVHWHIVQSLPAFFSQIAGYAYGDILAGYRPHVARVISMWLRYLIILPFPLLFLPYATIKIYSHRQFVQKLSGVPWYVVVMIVADAGVLWGSAKGWLQRLRGFHKMEYAK